jgi:hypothetical protein
VTLIAIVLKVWCAINATLVIQFQDVAPEVLKAEQTIVSKVTTFQVTRPLPLLQVVHSDSGCIGKTAIIGRNPAAKRSTACSVMEVHAETEIKCTFKNAMMTIRIFNMITEAATRQVSKTATQIIV